MNFKPTRPTIKVRIKGLAVTPESVRASELGEFIINIDRAITETAASRGCIDANTSAHDPIISLVDIDEGSNLLILSVDESLISATRNITHGISTRNYLDIPPKARIPLSKISQQATRLKWDVQFSADKKLHLVEARISEANPFPETRTSTASSETTVYGRLMRVGGITPKAMLLLPSDKLLYVDISEAIAKELALKDRLYSEVGIEGIATWRIDDWEIIQFRATRVLDYQPEKQNLVNVFESLARVAGNQWEDIDAIEFVNELRGRDEK